MKNFGLGNADCGMKGRVACLGCGIDRRGKILTAGQVDPGPWRLPEERGTRNAEPGTNAFSLYIAAIVWAGLCFGACVLAAERIGARQARTDAGLAAMAEDLGEIRAARLRMEDSILTFERFEGRYEANEGRMER